QGFDVERRTFEPSREGRGSEQAVEALGQLDAIFLGVELFELEYPELSYRRIGHHRHQARQVEIAAGPPLVLDESGEEDVGRAGHRVGLDIDQDKKRGNETLDLETERLGMFVPRQRRS